MSKEKIEYSNYISTEKFIIYSILSFGIYELVWMYRNWKFIKERENLDIMPFWRAVFAIFFIYDLSEKLLKIAKKYKYKKSYSSVLITIFFIVLALISKLPDPFWLISILGVVPLLYPLAACNYYWKKNDLNFQERSLKWWHIILIILGICWWILVLIGVFMPVD